MSVNEEKMEVSETEPLQPDVDALKANARDIVEKAAGQNGTKDAENGDTAAHDEPVADETAAHADTDNGKAVNGAEEHGDVTMNGESDSESNEAEQEKETNDNHADMKDTVNTKETVNGTKEEKEEKESDPNVEAEKEEKTSDKKPEGEKDKEGDSGKDGDGGKEEGKEEEGSKQGDPDTPKTKGIKTPKKKKKVEEVSLDDSPPLRRSSRKKTPTKYAELEKDIDFVVEDNDMEVEEIRDDDSDIQEVEPEDPLGGATISITKSTKSTFGKKPNVVTIDDLKTLQLLATSAKKSVDDQKKENQHLTFIDTQAILSGKMGSGVSITPAKPKTGLSITSAGLTLGSGVTIKPNTPKPPTSSVTITSTSTSSNHSSPVQKVEENYDPNLTDDTFVVEAPSFIVPYVYEKPPKEGIKDFKESIETLQKKKEKEEKEEAERIKKENEEETKKRREERKKKRDAGEEVEDDTEDEKEEEGEKKEGETEKGKEEHKDDTKKDEPEEIKDPEKEKEEKEKKEAEKVGKNAYFGSTLGKFFIELGMNLVQEYVQKDLLHQQKRRAHKDKSAAVMHAIMSLQKNLDDSKEQNEFFHHEMRKCKFCSFRTESRIVMQHHMETPHMKNFVYRCNFCEYETKIPQEVLFHMDSVHGVKGKLERAPYFHQCPQCPFEDNGKGKLTRHKLGCDKRFKSELNQMPDRDWDPPAKIKPQPMRPGYAPGYNYTAGKVGVPAIRPGQSLLPGRNFVQNQRMQMISNMNRGALASRGRPVGSYKGPADLRIPQPVITQQNKIRGMSPQMLASQQMLAALNSQGLSVYNTSKSSQVSSTYTRS